MRQEIDAKTQYLLQNQSLIEDSISVEETEQKDKTSVEDNREEEVPV